MDKRNFLRSSVFIGLAGLLTPKSLLYGKDSVEAPQSDSGIPFVDGPFEPISLPYAYDALEPHIDKLTMQTHYDKHYMGYTKKLNSAAEGTKYADMSIEDLLMKIGEKDKDLRNNGGGYYNHSLFWKWMSPGGTKRPTGKLLNAINEAFGSYEDFKKEFA